MGVSADQQVKLTQLGKASRGSLVFLDFEDFSACEADSPSTVDLFLL